MYENNRSKSIPNSRFIHEESVSLRETLSIFEILYFKLFLSFQEHTSSERDLMFFCLSLKKIKKQRQYVMEASNTRNITSIVNGTSAN